MNLSEFTCDVPDAASGDWRVETFEVDEQTAKFSRMRAALGHGTERVDAGRYKRLMRGGTVVMSNTAMELDTNRPIIRYGRGDVLINGLGLGLVVAALLKKPEVRSIRVIEKSADVIKLVGPTFASDPRVTIIHADAYEYTPAKGERFDAVWHDIWDNICSDNLPEMTRLTRKYARRTTWQDCWSKIECLRAKRRWG